MKLLVLAFVIYLTLNVSSSASVGNKKKSSKSADDSNALECETSFNETVSLVKPALLVGQDKWPTSIEAINKHCDLGQKVYKNIRRYSKCLSGISRQAINIFLRGLKKFLQNICLSEKKKQEAIDVLKCASDDSLNGWTKCLNVANQQMDATASNASDPAMVGNICCTYSTLIECVTLNTASKPNCIKKGSRYDTTGFLKASIDLVLKDLIELLCTNYATKEACDAHNAGRADILNSILQGKYRPVEGAFLLSPLVKAASQMGEIHADDI